MTIWRMGIACWIHNATDILSEYVIPIAFAQRRIVARTHLNVTLYVHWLACCFLCRCGPTLAMASLLMTFLDHTQRRTTLGWTLDEWSALRRDLFLTTHNTHNTQTSMPTVRFEPTVSIGERTQTYTLRVPYTPKGHMYCKLNCAV